MYNLILDRFSVDMDKLDNNIPHYTRWFLFNVTIVTTTLIVIGYSLPIFLVVVLPLGIFFLIIQVRIFHLELLCAYIILTDQFDTPNTLKSESSHFTGKKMFPPLWPNSTPVRQNIIFTTACYDSHRKWNHWKRIDFWMWVWTKFVSALAKTGHFLIYCV